MKRHFILPKDPELGCHSHMHFIFRPRILFLEEGLTPQQILSLADKAVNFRDKHHPIICTVIHICFPHLFSFVNITNVTFDLANMIIGKEQKNPSLSEILKYILLTKISFYLLSVRIIPALVIFSLKKWWAALVDDFFFFFLLSG